MLNFFQNLAKPLFLLNDSLTECKYSEKTSEKYLRICVEKGRPYKQTYEEIKFFQGETCSTMVRSSPSEVL